MILEHDGNTFELQFAELLVSLRLPLSNDTIAGNTSATDTVNSGTKPKVLSVAGVLDMNHSDVLSQLIKLAEAVDDTGARVVYNLSDATAKAADIRQVIFHGDFNVRKLKEVNAWQVTFDLRQKNSIAEAKEQRAANADTPVSDTATGQAVTGSEDTTRTDTADNTSQHGMMYHYLQKLDDWLAPDADS